jgi:hypothetical protein
MNLINDFPAHLLHVFECYGIKSLYESCKKYAEKDKEELTEDKKRVLEAINNWIDEIEKLASKPSHKVRCLEEVLHQYLSICDINEIKPVIIFTRRRALAREIEDNLRNKLDLEISLITGELEKSKREEILKAARSGNVDILVLTPVGEEGIDIPSAGLLIMMDLYKSELKFYQRLGRLLRKGKGKLKYLVMILTPETQEYDNADIPIERLLDEGVDLSYVIENFQDFIRKRGAHKIAEKEIRRIIEEENRLYVPISHLSGNILDFSGLIEKISLLRSLGDPVEVLFNVPAWGGLEKEVKSRIRKEIKLATESEISGMVRRANLALARGSLIYIYDPEALSSILLAIFNKAKEIFDRIKEEGYTPALAGEFGCWRLRHKEILMRYRYYAPIDKIKDLEQDLEKKMEKIPQETRYLVLNLSFIHEHRESPLPMSEKYKPYYSEERHVYTVPLRILFEGGWCNVFVPYHDVYLDELEEEDSNEYKKIMELNAFYSACLALSRFLETSKD